MIVLDTNVVSETMRRSVDAGVNAWLDAQEPSTLYLTSVTIAEIGFGIGLLEPGTRRQALTAGLGRLRDLYSGRILAFDEFTADAYADLAVRRRAAGRPLPLADGYIAAIAVHHGFAVATRNTRDFEGTGVTVVDPWT